MNTQKQYKTGYQRECEGIAKQKQKLDELKVHLDVLEEIRAKFPQIQMTVSAGLTAHVVNGALLHVNDIKDMRDVVPICRELVKAGYHTKGFEDYAELRRRTYDYGEIKVLAFLSYEEGATCRYVEVGKKEEPIYKLMCGQEEVIA